MKRFQEIYTHLIADRHTEETKKGGWQFYQGADRYKGLIAGMNRGNMLDVSLAKVANGKVVWEVKRVFNGKKMEWQLQGITQSEFEKLEL